MCTLQVDLHKSPGPSAALVKFASHVHQRHPAFDYIHAYAQSHATSTEGSEDCTLEAARLGNASPSRSLKLESCVL